MPPPKIPHHVGVTESERYLKHLCKRSFLSLWSYSGIYNDKGPGQEVCDLLVLFENHIIIFSDKDCEFPDTGNLELDWKRWYRKAVKKSADQVYGAERWIKQFPSRLFLDVGCKIPFPLDLPPLESMVIHRIVVAHAASERCVKHLGGSGSLLISNKLIQDSVPFEVGVIHPERGFVHVVDDTTLDILLTTLDTVSDFIEYLTSKENLFTSEIRINSVGEEELLATFLTEIDGEGNHCFLSTDEQNRVSEITIEKGIWSGFAKHPQRKAQIEANEASYFWDALIERFTKHFNEGTSHFNSHDDIKTQEQILRLLAKENRTDRRFLSEAFLEFLSRTTPFLKSSRFIRAREPNGSHYVFLAVPEGNSSYENYRILRRELLYSHLLLVKLQFPDAKDIIGIATESGRQEEGSEDLIYLDAENWGPIEQRRAERTRAELIQKKLFSPQHRFERTIYEYPLFGTNQDPAVQLVSFKGKHANKACPCGSGRKTKKCHGTS